MSYVVRTVVAIEQSDAEAADRLFSLACDELRRPAARNMSREAPGRTLQATAPVHEAYMRLVGSAARNWKDCTHFGRAPAEAMRRILIDNARRMRSLKRGGDHRRVAIEDMVLPSNDTTLSDFDEGLERPGTESKIQADLVKLRFFAGLTGKQAAEVPGISRSTADEPWAYASGAPASGDKQR